MFLHHKLTPALKIVSDLLSSSIEKNFSPRQVTEQSLDFFEAIQLYFYLRKTFFFVLSFCLYVLRMQELPLHHLGI